MKRRTFIQGVIGSSAVVATGSLPVNYAQELENSSALIQSTKKTPEKSVEHDLGSFIYKITNIQIKFSPRISHHANTVINFEAIGDASPKFITDVIPILRPPTDSLALQFGKIRLSQLARACEIEEEITDTSQFLHKICRLEFKTTPTMENHEKGRQQISKYKSIFT